MTSKRLPYCQRQKLTHRLRELVRKYPKGVGIFKEFLQNADDAGATTLKMCLDLRSFPKDRLPNTKMAQLQGRSLVFANDQAFTEEDWTKIQDIGNSGKAMDVLKTGRFGLGFNCVYNVTEYPMLLTRDRLGIFDPHANVVAGATDIEPGSAWKLSDLWEDHPDLLAPFLDYGLSEGQSFFDGTIFRLPLRTKAMAKKSEICTEPFKTSDFQQIEASLHDHVGELVLFLNSVLHFEITKTSSNGDVASIVKVTTQNEVKVAEIQDNIKTDLSSPTDTMLEVNELVGIQQWFLPHDLKIKTAGGSRTERWWKVRGIYGDSELIAAARKMCDFGEKAIPLAGAAVRIESKPISGTLACALPLPSASGTPFHIDGFFDLQDSRQDLFQDSSATSSSAKARRKWNQLLLQRGCAEAAAELLTRIGEETGEPIYDYWPTLSKESSERYAAKLPQYIFEALASKECISVNQQHTFVVPEDAKLIQPDLQEALLSEDVSLANPAPPHFVLKGLKATGTEILQLEPSEVRDLLREDQFEACDFDEADRECLRDKDWIVSLLKFCLDDEDYDDFHSVPLALMSDGLLRKFDTDEPTRLYIGNEADQNLLAGVDNLFLADEITHLGIERLPNVNSIGLDDAIKIITQLFETISSDCYVANDSTDEEIPSYDWLADFYNYCADVVKQDRIKSLPGQEALAFLPLVPDTKGRLWGMGSTSTPIFLPAKQRPSWLVSLLDESDISLTSDAGDVGKAIARFKSSVGDSEITTLTPEFLIDLVVSNPDTMLAALVSNQSFQTKFLAFISSDLKSSLFHSISEALSKLPIFPLVGGGVTSITDDVYQSTGFCAPSISANVQILDSDGGQWSSLFDRLGVRKLTRPQFVIDFILEDFELIDEDEQLICLGWLWENYRSLLNEISDAQKKEALVRKIRTTPLVRCEDGALHACEDIYHPDCVEIMKLLGSAANCPDMTIYKSDDWLEFFSSLGMELSARPRDIINALDCLAKRPLTSKTAKQIHRLAKFIEKDWETNHGELVDGELFSEALANRTWLPAISKCPSGVPKALFTRPDVQLYPPSQIARHFDLDLVCSEQPVCLFSIGHQFAAAIGHTSSTLETVLDHFDNVIESLTDSDIVDKSEARILKGIYKFIGNSLNDPDCLWTSDDLANRYSGKQCLIDNENCLWPPCKTFKARVPFFLNLRHQIRFSVKEADSCATAIGRKNSPTVVDFREFFEELLSEHAEMIVIETDLKNIRDAYLHASSICEPNDLASCAVLSESGKLLPSNEVLVDDAPWIAKRSRDAEIELLDDDLGDKVANAFGVGRLSEVVKEKIECYEECTDTEFKETCEKINQTIHSKQFAKGMLRLIASNSSAGNEFELLKIFEVVPANSVETVLHWDGEVIAGSLGESQFVFDDNYFYIAPTREVVLKKHISNTLAKQLFAGIKFVDSSCIADMLVEEPAQIESLLNDLHIPDLPTGRAIELLVDEFDDDLDEIAESSETEFSTEELLDHSITTSRSVNSTSGTKSDDIRHVGSDRNRFSESSSANSFDDSDAPFAGSGRTENDKPKTRSGRSRKKGRSSKRTNRAVSYAASGESQSGTDTLKMESERDRVDQAAVKHVERYEAVQRQPTVMDHYNEGYDIESRECDEDEVERYIEVKGLSGAWSNFGVKLTPAQVKFGKKHGDRHWLYVVEFALEPERFMIHMIQNPVEKITEFRFDAGWKQFCSETSSPTAAKPKKGSRVSVEGKGEGVVADLSPFGKFMRLRIDLDSGKTLKLNYPNRKLTVID